MKIVFNGEINLRMIYNSSIFMFPKNDLITKVAQQEFYGLHYLKKNDFDVISADYSGKDAECFLY